MGFVAFLVASIRRTKKYASEIAPRWRLDSHPRGWQLPIVFQKKILGLADSELAKVAIFVEESPKYLS